MMPLSLWSLPRLGLGRLGMGAFTPGQTPNALGFWDDTLSALNTKSDLSGAAPASGDPVGYVSGGTLTAGNALQATAANRPTLTIGSGFGWGSPASLGFTAQALTGAFTVYALGRRTSATIWTILGGTGGTAGNPPYLGVYLDNFAYMIPDVAAGYVFAAADPNGTVLIRFRRDAANVVYVHFTGNGGGESTLGTAAGTITFDTIAARTNTAEYSTAGNATRSLLIVNADTVTAGTDARIRSWYSTNRAVTIP